MQSLIRLFCPHCTDTDTLRQLSQMIGDRGSWAKSRNLLEAIRLKNVKAQRLGDRGSEAQYCFEEVCAKTLYNLTMQPAPYDPDTPHWITPNALGLTREFGLSPMDVVVIVDPPRFS